MICLRGPLVVRGNTEQITLVYFTRQSPVVVQPRMLIRVHFRGYLNANESTPPLEQIRMAQVTHTFRGVSCRFRHGYFIVYYIYLLRILLGRIAKFLHNRPAYLSKQVGAAILLNK